MYIFFSKVRLKFKSAVMFMNTLNELKLIFKMRLVSPKFNTLKKKVFIVCCHTPDTSKGKGVDSHTQQFSKQRIQMISHIYTYDSIVCVTINTVSRYNKASISIYNLITKNTMNRSLRLKTQGNHVRDFLQKNRQLLYGLRTILMQTSMYYAIPRYSTI